ncbi:MAG: PQQ-like beta-propeller repeat protein [Phycisphaerae bacterium]|nr:PQQ-like beta-propeller repeat protein [Phycisphaerae bacterium]
MKNFLIARVIPIFLGVFGAFLIFIWLRSDVATEFTLRLPGEDGSWRNVLTETEPIEIKGELIKFDGTTANLPGAWPRFRGSNFDGVSRQEMQLATGWPEQGPPLLWSIDVGEGYAGAAVLAGRVYVHDYDRENKSDVIRCLSLEDGKDIWSYSYPVKVKRNHGMSRTVPAVTEKYIVTLGPKCHVTSLDSVTGEFKWMINLVREFNTKVPQWYAGQCPLIDDNKAIIAPGGDSLMIAVDCETGEVLWRSPNPNGWKMTHSSIIPAEFMGKRMYIYCASGAVVGVDADDGTILWETTDWKIRIANVPSPVLAGDDLIFLSGGYNAGSMMLKLSVENEKIIAKPLFKLAPEVFGSAQQTPIFYNGYIYGVRPDGQLTCLDLTGKALWTSTSSEKFGLGPYIIINDLIYLMNDSGLLTLAKAAAGGFVKLAEAKVLEGPDSWGPMAVAGARLILRDMNRMICLDISEHQK